MTIQELEAKLTPEQKQRAFDIVESQGWTRDSTPPEYIWHEVFLSVLQK